MSDPAHSGRIQHISAIGDVAGKALLTPVAIAAGRRLSNRLFGGKEGEHLSYDNIPTVVFSCVFGSLSQFCAELDVC